MFWDYLISVVTLKIIPNCQIILELFQLKSFPAITKWTSYDVILFLYSMNIIPSIDIALDMIQSIISFTAPKPEDRSPKTAQKLIALKRDYSNRIKKISSLLK